MVLTTAIATSSKLSNYQNYCQVGRLGAQARPDISHFRPGKAPKLVKLQPGDPIAEHSLAAWQGMNLSASCCKDTPHTQEGNGSIRLGEPHGR